MKFIFKFHNYYETEDLQSSHVKSSSELIERERERELVVIDKEKTNDRKIDRELIMIDRELTVNRPQKVLYFFVII